MTKSEVKYKIERFAKEWNVVKLYTTDKDKDIEALMDELEIPYQPDCEHCNDTGKIDVRIDHMGEPAECVTEVCICKLDLDDSDY
jgi:hypothetical protein